MRRQTGICIFTWKARQGYDKIALLHPAGDYYNRKAQNKMKLLITGGTVFVSKFTASYFAGRGHEVYVLNRGTRPQAEGVNFIKADRNSLGSALCGMYFDAVIDVCAYKEADINNLLDAGIKFDDYVLISSSAVYPETLPQPFNERQPIGKNSIWGDYSSGKVGAEVCLTSRYPNAYVIRPPYLYGPMQNLYREPFVFECANLKRKFYIPGDGEMKLLFFHVEDLCRFIYIILKQHPDNHIFNVGNTQPVSISTFAELCYRAAGAPLEKVFVKDHPNQRDYFSFHNYEYLLDVSLQNEIMPEQKDLYCGLKESYEWYKSNKEEVRKKPYIDFIDRNFQ